MQLSIYEQLSELLTEKKVPFQTTRHDPVYTSEEAARVRGTTLASGAKALVCKTDDEFRLFVLPADRKLASSAVRRQLHIRSLRFANREEVLHITSLTPGSIPPFGSLFRLHTWCDQRLVDQPEINFNAGDHSVSISMRFEDFLAVERPTMIPLSG